MRNLRNIFKEYQSDPKVFRNLKIGFAALVVLGVLLFFAVSPGARHLIGIGSNHALPSHTVTPHRHHHPKVHPQRKVSHKAKRSSLQHPTKAHKERSKKNPLPVRDQGSEVVHTPEGSTPLPTPTHHEHHHGSSGGNPSSPESNPPPSSNQPAPTETPAKGGSPSSGSGSEPTPPPKEAPKEEIKPPVKVEVTPPKLGVELNVPPVTNAPPVEEVVGTVNETVNGVTGVVEETVNGLGTPVHVELPELCLVHC